MNGFLLEMLINLKLSWASLVILWFMKKICAATFYDDELAKPKSA